MKGKEFEMKILDKVFHIHTSNIVAGLLLIGSGILFVVSKGTAVINTLDPFKAKVIPYIVEPFLFEIPFIDLIGMVIFALFVFWVGYFIFSHSNKQN